MVSLKWGDVLSAILPGAVAVFAAAPWFPPLWKLVDGINDAQLTTGVAFLFAAAIAGGILEGVTRVSWEKWLQTKKAYPKGVLKRLTPENLPLYERSVQSSYKYVTFYANLAWATILAGITFALKSPNRGWLLGAILLVVIGVLLRASYVQWCYFVNYQTQVFGPGDDNATERSARGNQSDSAQPNPRGGSNAGGKHRRNPQ